MIYKFILFYNGQQYYDNNIVEYNDIDNSWKTYKSSVDTGVFGNFYPAKTKYTVNNTSFEFPTSENAFQASKTLDNNQVIKFCNIPPGSSFREGRKVNLRNDWEHVKVGIMRNILKEKFALQVLKQKLIATSGVYLIEHTPVKGRDKFWADDNNGSGQNMLGKLLMELRGDNINVPNNIVVELYKVVNKLKFN